ncbi:Coatomer subunit beta' [Terramyces sp. JEL0728]|nr:Coatomer subunit beta' [Terramyces sp. JEL0728]
MLTFLLAPITVTALVKKVTEITAYSKEVRFQVVGDWGSTKSKQTDFTNQKIVGKTMSSFADSDKTDFIVSLGDNFYGSNNYSDHGVSLVSDPKWTYDWIDVYNGPRLNSIPWYSVLGNHDWYQNQQAQIDFTAVNDRWFLEDYFYTKRFTVDGKKVEFFYITTELIYYGYDGEANSGLWPNTRGTAKDNNMRNNFINLKWTEKEDAIKKQLEYIEKKLDEGQHADYFFVVGHEDMVTCDGISSNMRPLYDLFHKYKITAYLFGHAHQLAYKQDGSVFFLQSGAGGRAETCTKSGSTWITSNEYGFANVKLTAKSGTVDFYNENGKMLTSTSFFPRQAPKSSNTTTGSDKVETSSSAYEFASWITFATYVAEFVTIEMVIKKLNQPLRLDIQKKFSNRSQRVKEVDFHPTEPWLLSAEYSGNVYIWNYETNALVKTFEVCDLPVRAAKFIARKSWLITGSDDFQLKVFNYNTHEKVTTFEAHVDYIRSIAVHHTLPLVLTASDDTSIKLWDWERGWKNIMKFDGHTHYVMQVVFNPKDSNTFASASMDRTVKVWSIGASVANYTLEGHKKGVNCVDYYDGADKPYLVSGADDKTIKVWDYQNKTCVQTLEGHTHNVIRVCYHPTLPIIVTGSEDGTIRMWHANTYRLENTLNYGMEKVWCMACLKGSNDMAFGYDDGTVTIKLGKEEPSVSMESSGKIIWAKQNEIKTANIQQLENHTFVDGEKIVVPIKELGSCEIFPQTLKHSPNGRFVVVCGDGEYIIYTALAWRNKSFGQALECVWANDSNQYAIRESTSKIKLYKSFKEVTNVSIRPSYSAEGIFGGSLLGVKSSTFIVFYDWETGAIARRIDVACNNVFWSESDYATITTNEGFYILKFNRATFQTLVETQSAGDEGYEEAFEFITEVSEKYYAI